ncbi:glutamate 5-kinase [Marininema mesophilum]|uniref:Glutamate 5-kinase n=1 Tax=Marininema mesophilum TaxID=1048340 RepID=A0A1H2SHG1_9BACL|nr:glutamate 5-kinase [Marininema mesophilum]SDW30977.1 glutamate 5-kinase [Marininema mesophilum]
MDRQTVVVKIGTSSLTNENGQLDEQRLAHHVAGIVELKKKGYHVVVVSSGGIAAGFHELGLTERPRTLAGKQAAAAVGQGALIQCYREHFFAKGISCAQVLLTRSDFDNRSRYLNALHTLNYLLKREVVPIINENDSVAVDEICWGDNDTLAALVAGLLQADEMILVTNTNGLFTDNPHKYPGACRIPMLDKVDEELLQQLDDSKSAFGSGGMRSKLVAVRMATEAGVRAHIGTEQPASDWMFKMLIHQETGTTIVASPRRISRKEHWIALHSGPAGQVHVDRGAARALLEEGRSLLPIGVVKVEGDFQVGDIVIVIDPTGTPIGRGMSRYPAEWLAKVKGKRSEEVFKQEPRYFPEEVIHRNDWVSTSMENALETTD